MKNAHLGTTVLARLGRRHVHDLAWEAVDEDEATLADRRSLSREEQSRAGNKEKKKRVRKETGA